MNKEKIIQAVRVLAEDRDLDPQSRYDMLGEIGAIVEEESDALLKENDLDEYDLDDEFEIDAEFDHDFDDEDDFDGEFDFDDEDDFDPEDR